MLHYDLDNLKKKIQPSYHLSYSFQKNTQLLNTLSVDAKPNSSHSPSNLPSLRCPNEELTEEPALFILIVSDGVVEFMAHSNLHIETTEKSPDK